MDRVIYLVRHGEPVLEQGRRICLGQRSNPALSPRGREQAKALAHFLPKGLPVYCSPLARSRETAQYLSDHPHVIEELTECDMGPWDGLDFDTIRQIDPLLYARREYDHALLPLGAESYAHAAERMQQVLAEIRHDAVIVGHAGAIRAFLCPLMNLDYARNRDIPLAYGSVTQLVAMGRGQYKADFVGRMPQLYPSEEEIRRLFFKQRTPQTVIAHCEAVALFALELADAVGRVDHRLLYAAAMLHDLCRTQKEHASQGAHVLHMQGYPEIARIIGMHHSPKAADGRLDEAALLFYADKRVRECSRISLSERFEKTLIKCVTPQAKMAHEAQRRAAEKIEQMIRQAGCQL